MLHIKIGRTGRYSWQYKNRRCVINASLQASLILPLFDPSDEQNVVFTAMCAFLTAFKLLVYFLSYIVHGGHLATSEKENVKDKLTN